MMAGPHTLAETERTVAERLAGLPIDHGSMAVTSNLFRAANAVRNYMEREVLTPNDLTWTAFVVMWVTWIWGPAETRMIASESTAHCGSPWPHRFCGPLGTGSRRMCAG